MSFANAVFKLGLGHAFDIQRSHKPERSVHVAATVFIGLSTGAVYHIGEMMYNCM